MWKLMVVAAALSLGTASTAALAQQEKKAQTAQQGQKATDAKSFVKQAMVSNQFEIESSKLALEKATDPQLQQFAKQMIDEHQAVGKKLKETLQKAKVEAPDKQALDQKHEGMIEKLEKAKGPEFNRSYRQMQVQAHESAVNLFQSYAEGGDNKQLQQFAAATLPNLKKHLQQIESIEPQTAARKG